LRKKYEMFKKLGRDDVEWLEDDEDIKRKAPHLRDADLRVS
jgi:hypothetical protein